MLSFICWTVYSTCLSWASEDLLRNQWGKTRKQNFIPSIPLSLLQEITETYLCKISLIFNSFLWKWQLIVTWDIWCEICIILWALEVATVVEGHLYWILSRSITFAEPTCILGSTHPMQPSNQYSSSQWTEEPPEIPQIRPYHLSSWRTPEASCFRLPSL